MMDRLNELAMAIGWACMGAVLILVVLLLMVVVLPETLKVLQAWIER